MKKLFSAAAFIVVAFSSVFFVSCNKDAANELAPNVAAGKQFVTYKTGADLCGQVTSVRFLAGQNKVAGTVEVGNDADSVYVTYSTTGPWRMRMLHLYVGKCSTLPINKSGNPVPGQFPFKKSFGSYSATTYTFSFPKSMFDDCFCVAAHAEVAHANGSNAETAWGEGTRFVAKGNWGMYFSACKQDCPPNDPCAIKPTDGCAFQPSYVLNPNSPGFSNGTVVVGGNTYSGDEAGDIYLSAQNSSDAYNAFLVVGAIKLSAGSIATDAGILCQVQIVESWLATLGKLDAENINYTAPQDVKDAIATIQQWLAANDCL